MQTLAHSKYFRTRGITRAFLNLISNGVYAATQRKIEKKRTWF